MTAEAAAAEQPFKAKRPLSFSHSRPRASSSSSFRLWLLSASLFSSPCSLVDARTDGVYESQFNHRRLSMRLKSVVRVMIVGRRRRQLSLTGRQRRGTKERERDNDDRFHQQEARLHNYRVAPPLSLLPAIAYDRSAPRRPPFLPRAAQPRPS